MVQGHSSKSCFPWCWKSKHLRSDGKVGIGKGSDDHVTCRSPTKKGMHHQQTSRVGGLKDDLSGITEGNASIQFVAYVQDDG